MDSYGLWADTGIVLWLGNVDNVGFSTAYWIRLDHRFKHVQHAEYEPLAARPGAILAQWPKCERKNKARLLYLHISTISTYDASASTEVVNL